MKKFIISFLVAMTATSLSAQTTNLTEQLANIVEDSSNKGLIIGTLAKGQYKKAQELIAANSFTTEEKTEISEYCTTLMQELLNKKNSQKGWLKGIATDLGCNAVTFALLAVAMGKNLLDTRAIHDMGIEAAFLSREYLINAKRDYYTSLAANTQHVNGLLDSLTTNGIINVNDPRNQRVAFIPLNENEQQDFTQAQQHHQITQQALTASQFHVQLATRMALGMAMLNMYRQLGILSFSSIKLFLICRKINQLTKIQEALAI